MDDVEVGVTCWVQRVVVDDLDAGTVGTVVTALWWASQSNGKRILMVGVVEDISGALSVSKYVATLITTRNVSADIGLENGMSATVMKGGACFQTFP